MAEFILRAQVTLPSVSGIPEDACNNTFHFDWDDAGGLGNVAAVCDEIQARLLAFYQDVDEWLSSTLATTFIIDVYDLADPEPRAPIGTRTIGGFVFSTFTAPREVAVVSSFQGVTVSGLPQARRRGRLYIGPLGEAVISSGAAGDARPSQALIDDVVAAAVGLQAANGDGLFWVVYSPTNNNTVGINNGWVDNAFDTQRRRGTAATARTLWP